MDNSSSKPISLKGMWHLGVVYVVWSSTYLAIRVAVREGGGFPPFTLGMMRTLAAGFFLLGWARLSRLRLNPTRQELATLAVVGLLLWTGGNGMVSWAEQYAASGLTALIVAATPIWSMVIEAVIDRKSPSPGLLFSLLAGFLGIGVLALPSFSSGVKVDLMAALALIGAGITWSLGSVLQARRSVNLHARVSSAYQMIFGGLGFSLLLAAAHEPAPTPTPAAWGAFFYLLFFGSVLAFTSFVTALQILPTNIVLTYAYVNPVIAVFLGWLILKEEITPWTIGGSLLVLLGVAGVFRDRYKPAGG